MAEMLQENWIFIAILLAILLAVIWWYILVNRKTKVEIAPKDETASAKRNQALIDAAPASLDGPEATQLAASKPEPAPSAPPPSAGDDLTLIKGLGPKLKTLLGELGVTTFAQIAAWDDAEIDRIDSQLGRFEGRIRRDSWVEQAKLLAADNRAEYENQFGRT